MRTHPNRILALVATSAVLSACAPALAQKQIVRLVFDGPVLESPSPDAELMAIFGQGQMRTLHQWVRMIDKAARDKKVDGLAVIIESPAVGLAQIEELTRAFERFRASGKKIYVYLDAGENSTYALAAAADHVTLAENSSLFIVGLNAELSFYKGLLDKIGVKADMMHCGDYKSALEPYTRTEPSKEAAEQVNWLLTGIYERWVELIAKGRGLTVEQTKALIDQAPIDAEPALKARLVDAVGSFGDYARMLQKEFGQNVKVVKDYGDSKKLELPESPFEMFSFFMKLGDTVKGEQKPGIGLIYIEGGIATGKSTADFLSGTTAGSTTIRAALEAARRNDAVKAVVLRVDSPGGSALASDIIWKAATRLAAEKPLIVSMGGVAGSGGYYVSIPGDTVFAEASTITGSIGVVGGKLVWSGLMEDKLGITTTEFKRGQRADLFSPNRMWTDEERAWMQNWMNGIYTQFKQRVSESRGKRIKGDLEKLAGGRVYTGKQALELGPVDRIGGLHDALSHAADKVGLSEAEYPVYILPKPEDFAAILAKLFGEKGTDEYEIASGAAPPARFALGATWPAGAWSGMSPGGAVPSWLSNDPALAGAAPLLNGLAPQQARRLLLGLRHLAALNQEHVGLFMAWPMSIR